jgi:hypothetical protein
MPGRSNTTRATGPLSRSALILTCFEVQTSIFCGVYSVRRRFRYYDESLRDGGEYIPLMCGQHMWPRFDLMWQSSPLASQLGSTIHPLPHEGTSKRHECVRKISYTASVYRMSLQSRHSCRREVRTCHFLCKEQQDSSPQARRLRLQRSCGSMKTTITTATEVRNVGLFQLHTSATVYASSQQYTCLGSVRAYMQTLCQKAGRELIRTIS